MSFRLIGRLSPGSLMFVMLACQSSVSSTGGADQPGTPAGQPSASAAPTQPAPTAYPTYQQPAPTAAAPTAGPTPAPAPTPVPGQSTQPTPAAPAPTAVPTTLPTTIPTTLPTAIPTTLPTAIPTTWPPQTTPPATEPAPAPTPGAKVRTEGDRILLPGNVVFDTGKAVLSPAPENQVILNQLKQFLIDNPRVSTVRIEGYTDNVGQAAANLKLSGERALAIKQWLIANGIAAERVMAVGFGQEKPIADNSTAAGRAQNRRTEFKIAAVKNRPYRGVPVNGGGTEFK